MTEKKELPTFADPNSPKALKAASAKAITEKAKAKRWYIVIKPQLIDGEWILPSDEKSKPKLIEQLPVQAEFKLLNGKLKKATSTQITAFKKAQEADKTSNEKA